MQAFNCGFIHFLDKAVCKGINNTIAAVYYDMSRASSPISSCRHLLLSFIISPCLMLQNSSRALARKTQLNDKKLK